MATEALESGFRSLNSRTDVFMETAGSVTKHQEKNKQ